MSTAEGSNRPLSAVGAIAAVSVAALTLASCGGSDDERQRAAGKNTIERLRDSHERIGRRPSVAATNAEPASLMPGIGRPCHQAKGFDHYYLGRSFAGLPLTGKGWQCTPPPRKVRTPRGSLVYSTPGRVNAHHYIYGRCAAPPYADTEGGCAPPLSLSSSPSCERPHSIVRRYGGSAPLRHTHGRIRRAPAALYSEPGPAPRSKIEIFTGDAVVMISGEDRELVRRAAARIVAAPTSRYGARTPRSRLPAPTAGAAEDGARRNPRC